MRLTFFYIFFVTTFFSVFGQKPQAFFYSDVWKITTPENSSFNRQSILDTANLRFLGPVLDSYKNGIVQMEGYYKGGLKHGYFKFYYEDGTLKREGLYKEDVRDSVWTYYNDQGQQLSKVMFENDDFSVLEHSNNGEAVTNGTGDWSFSFYEQGSPVELTITGSFQEGQKHGWWKMNDQYGNLIFKEKFKNGLMTSGNFYNKAGQLYAKYDQEIKNKFPDDSKFTATEYFFISDSSMLDFYPFLEGKDIMIEDYGFTNVDQGAEYIGGIKQLYLMIAEHMIYPEFARKNDIEGTVYVSFIVSKYGFPHSMKIEQGIGGECDEEALRVLNYMGRWNPGYKNGRPVNMRYVLPIVFRLTG